MNFFFTCNKNKKKFKNNKFLLRPFRQSVEETDVSDSSDVDDTEKLGEKLFSLVEKLDQIHANDITGDLMLCL